MAMRGVILGIPIAGHPLKNVGPPTARRDSHPGMLYHYRSVLSDDLDPPWPHLCRSISLIVILRPRYSSTKLGLPTHPADQSHLLRQFIWGHEAQDARSGTLYGYMLLTYPTPLAPIYGHTGRLTAKQLVYAYCFPSGIQMRLGYHPIIKHEIERLYTSVFAIRTNSSGALGLVR